MDIKNKTHGHTTNNNPCIWLRSGYLRIDRKQMEKTVKRRKLEIDFEEIWALHYIMLTAQSLLKWENTDGYFHKTLQEAINDYKQIKDENNKQS